VYFFYTAKLSIRIINIDNMNFFAAIYETTNLAYTLTIMGF